MDLVRPLGRAGIPTVVVSRPGLPQSHSRFNRGTIRLADVREHPEELVRDLIAFGSGEFERPVLMVDQDEYLLVVSRHRAELEPYFRFILADPILVEDLVDKERFRILGDRLGLPVPMSQRLDPANMSPADVVIEYPLLIKPLTRRDRNLPWAQIAGEAKAIKVDSRIGLEAIWPTLVAAGTHLVAQVLIPGPETRIETYHVYCDVDGRIAGEFTGREVRTFPRDFGHSTAVETTEAADVRTLGRELVGRIGLIGVAKLDFKRGPDRKLHLLEINPRFSFWNHPGAVAGVHLAELVYRDLTGARIRPAHPAAAGVRWCDVVPDALAARAIGMPLLSWLRWVLRSETRAEVAADDPLPFLLGTVWRQRTGIMRRLMGRPPNKLAS
ncbi:MAG TPA: ATP-grasp domain-containing protein [Candidatus Dormibacteraeota bacterium]|nr:ATP-grasp domain-containing protein [Candidatus Dormibacteraeota bacterium]